MTEQLRIPQPGEGWRHFKGGYTSLYRIIGTGRDENGNAVVIYAPYSWSLASSMPLYVRQFGDFIKEIDFGTEIETGKKFVKQRFQFEREAQG